MSRRMFTRKHTTQEIPMEKNEQDARGKPESEWLVGADRMRETICAWVLLAVCFVVVIAAGAGVFG